MTEEELNEEYENWDGKTGVPIIDMVLFSCKKVKDINNMKSEKFKNGGVITGSPEGVRVYPCYEMPESKKKKIDDLLSKTGNEERLINIKVDHFKN